MKNIIVKQLDQHDCGICSIKSVIKYYGGNISLEKLRNMTNTDKSGTNAYEMVKTLTSLGFSAKGVKFTFEKNKRDDALFDEEVFFPFIAHVVIGKRFSHYVVVYKINRKTTMMTIMDPAKGLVHMLIHDFLDIWSNYAIFLYPNSPLPEFKDITNTKFLIKLLEPHKKLLINIVLLSGLFTIFSISNSYYFKYIIDSFNSMYNFRVISLIFLLIIILKIISNFFRNMLAIYINEKIDLSLLEASFNHIIHLPYSYFKTRTTGEITSRIGDLSVIKESITSLAMTLFVDSVMILFAGIFLYSISSKLTFVAFILIFLYYILFLMFSPIFKEKIFELEETKADVDSYLVESLKAYEMIKGLNIENIISDKITKKFVRFLKINFWTSNKFNTYTSLKDTISYIGVFVILYMGGILVNEGSISIGELVTFNSVLLYFLDPIRNLIDMETKIRYSLVSLERIKELFTVEKELVEIKNKLELNGSLKISDLSFSYNMKDNLIEHLSLDIPISSKIIITGSSGSGKSTFVKLLLKYYEVRRGHIFIDDYDICDLDLPLIRENITYIPQKESLYRDTLYENVVMNRKVAYEEFLNICNNILLTDITINNPLGFNMIIEEDGFNISGGQRQRISLARAMLKMSKIFIMDESLNEVDVKSERIILKNLFNLMSNVTIIYITHRNNNSDLFDKIYEIKNKKLELLKSKVKKNAGAV